MNARILLIEDDRNLAETILHYLELNGLVCDYGEDGQQGLALVGENSYDVIVSDVNMPRIDGLAFCQTIRTQGDSTSLLLLTANSDLEDKIKGFESGADDYLTKPFAMAELLLRIHALAKRSSGAAKILELKELGLVIDYGKRQVSRDGEPIELTRSGWTILERLARAWPDAVRKEDLEFSVWGEDVPDSNSLKVHIHRLRQRLDKPFNNRSIVKSVAGYGFRLSVHD